MYSYKYRSMLEMLFQLIKLCVTREAGITGMPPAVERARPLQRPDASLPPAVELARPLQRPDASLPSAAVHVLANPDKTDAAAQLEKEAALVQASQARISAQLDMEATIVQASQARTTSRDSTATPPQVNHT